MKNILDTIKLVVSLLPVIKETILKLEELFPTSGQGANKKAILNATLDSIIAKSAEYTALYETARPVIQILIDVLCKIIKVPKPAVEASK